MCLFGRRSAARDGAKSRAADPLAAIRLRKVGPPPWDSQGDGSNCFVALRDDMLREILAEPSANGAIDRSNWRG